MNELIQVDKQIAEIESRSKALKTQNGRIRAEQEMMSVLAVMEIYGYRVPQGEKIMISRAWVDVLEEYIATYGMQVVRASFKSLAQNDTRKYKDFPRPSDVIAEIKARGGRDPRITKAHIEARRREEILHEEHMRENA